ncbi:hypothetical protein D3C76_1403360 [compost metagenome]
MGKKKGRPAPSSSAPSADKPATLKDLLGEGTIAKLKAQANELKKEEEQRKEQEQIKAEEARRAERKRLDNDFEHLLNTSEMDWHKYK